MTTRVDYDPPIRAAVTCRTCGDEIVAKFKVITETGEVGYGWRHESTGHEPCAIYPVAWPRDGWDANRRVEAALREREVRRRHRTRRGPPARRGDEQR